MFIGAGHPSNIRSVRSEICFRPAKTSRCCAPRERDIISGDVGYKHFAPPGRIDRRQLAHSKLNPEMTNGKSIFSNHHFSSSFFSSPSFFLLFIRGDFNFRFVRQ
jgi:hypothetical protein